MTVVEESSVLWGMVGNMAGQPKAMKQLSK